MGAAQRALRRKARSLLKLLPRNREERLASLLARLLLRQWIWLKWLRLQPNQPSWQQSKCLPDKIPSSFPKKNPMPKKLRNRLPGRLQEKLVKRLHQILQRTLLKRMRQKLQQMPSPSQSNDVGAALFQRVADKVIIDE